ncbi:GNAT family N-acetyltransferase [Haloechinothrix salitolerans]|uniref:GNAT family N-acetyltransferase n=1 Tax=Haloechinothrix salitolerans TaxID=926830 RepID=A0ABW2C8I1_9PSEU
MIDDALRAIVSSGDYGSLVPVLPTTDTTLGGSCPRGHDFRIARVSLGHSHLYDATTVTCEVCRELGHEHSTWALIDPFTHTAEPPGRGLALVVTPPSVRGGLGQIAVYLGPRSVADADLMICAPCRRAVLEQIRVDPGCRRRGLGRLLVAASVMRAPSDRYRWSTTPVNNDPEVLAFWSRIPFPAPSTLGTPEYCSDMRTAAGIAE